MSTPTVIHRRAIPTSSINIMTSGVSGYQTTGVNGNFDFQIHRPMQVTIDPSVSSFSIQNHIPRVSSNRFEMAYNLPDINFTAPIPNVGNNIATPTVVFDQSQTVLQSSLGYSRDLQAGLEVKTGTYLNDIIYQGGYQEDPLVSRMFQDDLEPVQGQFISPTSDRHSTFGVDPTVRQNDFSGHGTINPTSNIKVTPLDTEQGQYALQRLQQTQPQMQNGSNAGTNTHPSHAQGIGTGTPNLSARSFNTTTTTSMQASPYPYLDLGQPPQPMEYIPQATGQLSVKQPLAMRSVPGVPIQFML